MKLSIDTILRRTILGGITVILLTVPFHAFLTVWAASALDHYTLLRLWKEVVLLVLVAVTGCFLYRHPLFLADVWQQKLLRLLVIYSTAYITLTIITGLIAIAAGRVQSLAVGYSYISNLRFLGFFAVCLVAAAHYRAFWVLHWQKLLLVPASIVILIGLLQLTVLPADFLKHFGYSDATVHPYIAVDNKPEFARLQSTLRGPNPLGAYLLIPLAVLTGLVILRPSRRALGALLAGCIVLLGTYSRSAWLGLFLLLIFLGATLLRQKLRRYFMIGLAAFVIISVGAIFVLRDNNFVQNVVFHTDETSQSSNSSNEDRAGALQGGFGDLVREPFGRGPGTAGPASVYNDDQARISENYFLQIGQEVGLLGLGLFVAICGLVATQLWVLRGQSVLPIVLLAGLVGISFVNFLSHAWTDDTLAYIWWGFAGIAIGMHLFDSKKGKRRTF